MSEHKIDYQYKDLEELVKETYHEPDLDLLKRSYKMAEKAHEGEKRKTGHDFITHPVSASYKLAQMKLSLNVICAGLLHDVVEDTDITIDDLKEQFNEDIANLVNSVTKLKKVKYTGDNLYAENMRRMFLAMSEDVRVVFIKFSDRLHNLKTLYARPREKQLRVSKEVLEIYAPIANRLGMGFMRGEMEDLAFMYANPQAFQKTNILLENIVREKQDIIVKAKEVVLNLFDEESIEVHEIGGRIKRLYSLYKKLQRYDNDISKIFDIVAIRVVVDDVSECYAALGVLHKRWTPLKGRIKDYIAQPKPNGYQSLHTTVFLDDGTIVEFQVRTREMHEHAEYGIAAHWQYKEGAKKIKTRDVEWMKELVTIQKTLKEKKDFLDQIEDLKLDVFKDRIFVFTPKGDVIDLPEGSTPVDFAYAIHTEIGNTCTGACINNKIANLDTELKSGDMCEILTDKNRKGPNPDWLKFVKTHHASVKIKDQTKKKMRGWFKQIKKNRN